MGKAARTTGYVLMFDRNGRVFRSFRAHLTQTPTDAIVDEAFHARKITGYEYDEWVASGRRSEWYISTKHYDSRI